MKPNFQFTDVDSALSALAERLVNVSASERTNSLVGRILAEPITADRDSPAADVSAMDGYAIRLADLNNDAPVAISGESKAGQSPPTMIAGKVVRIFTGAVVPEGCEAIVKREETDEELDSVRFHAAAKESTVAGSHIRRQGENAPAGSSVLSAGVQLSPASVAALANFGIIAPSVFRTVKVTILTTGDEVLDPSTDELEPWQLRNSNQAALVSMLSSLPFVSVVSADHLPDRPDALNTALIKATESSDVVVMTGGVSKGDYDYVPETIAKVGGEIVFHGLPIRPGKPILGAATGDGKLILGLPGNPVSTTINGRRFLLPLLRHLGGCSDWRDQPAMVTLTGPPAKSIPLHTMQLVKQVDHGIAELIPSKGSGDLVALSQSDGFLCLPPEATTIGPWPLLRW